MSLREINKKFKEDLDKIDEKIEKLKRLARSTTFAGEANAANKQLQLLIKKYKLTPEKIIQVELVKQNYNYCYAWQKKLILQIYSMVINKKNVQFNKSSSERKIIHLFATEIQHVKIKELYILYNREFQNMINDTYIVAFIQVNNIFAPDPDDAPEKKPHIITVEEQKRKMELSRARKSMKKINRDHIFK